MLMAQWQADAACNDTMTPDELNSMQQELSNAPITTEFGAVAGNVQHHQHATRHKHVCINYT